MMFKVGDIVVANTAFSHDELSDELSEIDMYRESRLELLNGTTFNVAKIDLKYDGIDAVRLRTMRGTTVVVPIKCLQLFDNILNEGEEI